MKIRGYKIFLRITRFVILVIRPDYQKLCSRSTPDQRSTATFTRQCSRTMHQHRHVRQYLFGSCDDLVRIGMSSFATYTYSPSHFEVSDRSLPYYRHSHSDCTNHPHFKIQMENELCEGREKVWTFYLLPRCAWRVAFTMNTPLTRCQLWDSHYNEFLMHDSC